ncbi:MAG: ABC transporter permease [Acidobacteria bacterium]|nr:ABC transporter permease [Acidobacteriota bacterium]
MNAVTLAVSEIQETTLLAGRTLRESFRRPFYFKDIVHQMDLIGVGSLSIVLLTGLFTGGILAIQTGSVLRQYGVLDFSGQLVMTTMVRALGPVLACIMLAGRVGSGIAAELGSMVVTEQIDALRALGTSPIKKLVWPRLVALLVMAPSLTLLADIVGAFGGWIVATNILGVTSSTYISTAKSALNYNDIFGGVLKPTVYGFIIAIVSCRAGLRTRGGTVGVGRSTTQSVVLSSILIIAVDFFISKLLLALGDMGFLR